MDSTEETLFRAIVPYIPSFLVEELAHQPDLPLMRGLFRQGTLLLADIAGFTAISERLSERGREGSEELAKVINNLFTKLLGIASSYRGSQIEFAGDATLILFLGPEHTARAVRCALRMQLAMKTFHRIHTSQGSFSLQMHVGINSGEFFVGNLGSPTGRVFCVVIGREVNRTAEIAETAHSGEIFVGFTTLNDLNDRLKLGHERKGHYQVTGLNGRVKTAKSYSLDFEQVKSNNIIDALASYLVEPLQERIKTNPNWAGIGGEHRKSTVMFINLLGSLEIVERLGSERASEIVHTLDEYYSMVQAIVKKYGGLFLGCYISSEGDKILIVFGAPASHEDDENRTILCALELRERLAASNLPLQQRIGIGSGYVYSGDIGSATSKEYSVIGNAVNLAARLMDVAKEGQILVDHSTYSRTAIKFFFGAGKSVWVKGKRQQVTAYEVQAVREDVITHRQSSERELIGRVPEIAKLKEISKLAMSGHTQFAAITGVAGIGKSRLSKELELFWANSNGLILRGNCRSYGENVPFLPWSELLSSFFQLQKSEPVEQRAKRIENTITDLCPEMEHWAALIGNLLNAPISESKALKVLEPQIRHQRLLHTILELIVAQAKRAPLLLLLEDLHWADASSVELLNYLTTNIRNCPILFCVAYRPKEALKLEVKQPENYTNLQLEELSIESSLDLVRSIVGTSALPEELRQFVLKKSRGNPLYIEELVGSLIGAGHLRWDDKTGHYRLMDDLSTGEMPDTIRDIIMARLDQLEDNTIDVLRSCSVIGPSFQYEVLKYIYPRTITDKELTKRLGDMARVGLILEDETKLPREYSFKHILTQEVAYDSMLFAQRRELHHKIGEYFEIHCADRIESYYELLYHHYSRTNDKDKSLEYSFKSGDKARKIFANEEAVRYYQRALEVTGEVSGNQSLASKICENLGDIYELTGRYDQALQSYESSHRWYGIIRRKVIHHTSKRKMAKLESSLSCLASTPDIEKQISILCGKRGMVYERKGQYVAALGWLNKGLKRLSDDCRERACLCTDKAGVLYRLGKHAQALDWCQEGLDIARGVSDLSSVAHILYLFGTIHADLGNIKQSMEYRLQSLSIYEEINDLQGQEKVHNNLGVDFYYQGKWGKCREHYYRSFEIAEKIGHINGVATVSNNLGEVLSDQGHLEEAIISFSRCLEIWEATGYSLGIALSHSNLGRAYTRLGDHQKAMSHLEEGLQMFEQIQSKGFLTECYHRLAEAFCDHGQQEKALAYCERSLLVAVELKMNVVEGAIRRTMGQAYRYLGQWDKAKELLGHSERILRECNVPHELSRTLWEFALLSYDMERAGLSQGTQEKIKQKLNEAVYIFEILEIKYDQGKVAEMQAYCESK